MWKSIVKKQIKYNKNMDICRRITLFFKADKIRNITLACKKLGYKRAYYYYWWNRFKAAGCDILTV